MLLGEYIDKSLVLPDLRATDKTAVLREMTAALEAALPTVDAEAALAVLLDREGLGTTGIGDGIAIPHGKIGGLDHIVLCIGRSLHGVDFESLDYKPCTMFFLVLAPEQVAGMHLRILAQISRQLKDESFRRDFLEAPDRDALYALLAKV